MLNSVRRAATLLQKCGEYDVRPKLIKSVDWALLSVTRSHALFRCLLPHQSDLCGVAPPLPSLTVVLKSQGQNNFLQLVSVWGTRHRHAHRSILLYETKHACWLRRPLSLHEQHHYPHEGSRIHHGSVFCLFRRLLILVREGETKGLKMIDHLLVTPRSGICSLNGYDILGENGSKVARRSKRHESHRISSCNFLRLCGFACAFWSRHWLQVFALFGNCRGEFQ